MQTLHFHVIEHVLPATLIRERRRVTKNKTDILQLAVKQYKCIAEHPGCRRITVIGAHANGFPKELYEPIWDDLQTLLLAQNIVIDSVFIADVTGQAASGILNKHKLANDSTWMDHPRDLFLMINHFRDQMTEHLVGIGHSMGANNLVNLSMMHPRLFTTVILIESAMLNFFDPSVHMIARNSLARREKWPSREAALASHQKSPFYRIWDPRVLERWIQYGFVEDTKDTSSPTPSVTLATPREREVVYFVRPEPERIDTARLADANGLPWDPLLLLTSDELVDTQNRLPRLLPGALFIHGGGVTTRHIADARMMSVGRHPEGSGGVEKGRAKEVCMLDGDHFLPFTHVKEVAEAIAPWIVGELQWADAEEARELKLIKDTGPDGQDVFTDEIRHLILKSKFPKAKERTSRL